MNKGHTTKDVRLEMKEVVVRVKMMKGNFTT